MSVQVKTDIYTEFLKKFTEEILLVIMERVTYKNSELEEKQRITREIEAEKLRMKFKVIPSNQQSLKPSSNPLVIEKKIVEPFRLKENKVQKEAIAVGKEIRPIPMKVNPMNSENNDLNEYGVNFGRLTSAVLNPSVTYIDCSGPNREITLKARGIFLADITLNKEEIEAIIKSFSEKARIPLIEGMLKARIKNLEMAAVVSLAGSSFVLKKISPNVFSTNNFKTNVLSKNLS
jgi:hypothetical protein